LPSGGKRGLLCAVRTGTRMSEANQKNAKPGENRGQLVYVVDDEPMLLELATVILEPQGYQIQAFRDPELAVEAFAKASPRPAVVITDYAMHSMNGMQLIEQLRRLEPRQKILMVSGTVGADVFSGSPSKPDL